MAPLQSLHYFRRPASSTGFGQALPLLSFDSFTSTHPPPPTTKSLSRWTRRPPSPQSLKDPLSTQDPSQETTLPSLPPKHLPSPLPTLRPTIKPKRRRPTTTEEESTSLELRRSLLSSGEPSPGSRACTGSLLASRGMSRRMGRRKTISTFFLSSKEASRLKTRTISSPSM